MAGGSRGLAHTDGEAVGEDGEDDDADGGVDEVALAGEADDAEDDPGDGGGNEEDESCLNDAGRVEVEGSVNDSAEGAEGGGGWGEVGVVGVGKPGIAQIEDAAEEDDEGGEGDADAEHGGDGEVEFVVGGPRHGLDGSFDAAVDHLEAEDDDDEGEDDLESGDVDADEDAGSDE